MNRIRLGSLAALTLILLESGLGTYVNLYVTVPAAGHHGDLGRAITNGPAVLSVHAVAGLLLGLAATGVLAQAIRGRHWRAAVASAFGLMALAFADVAGAGYISTADAGAAMAMAVFTGVALLCYAANLYLAPPGRNAPVNRRGSAPVLSVRDRNAIGGVEDGRAPGRRH